MHLFCFSKTTQSNKILERHQSKTSENISHGNDNENNATDYLSSFKTALVLQCNKHTHCGIPPLYALKNPIWLNMGISLIMYTLEDQICVNDISDKHWQSDILSNLLN